MTTTRGVLGIGVGIVIASAFVANVLLSKAKRKEGDASISEIDCSPDFQEAAKCLKSITISDTGTLLRLYGLYKRSTKGLPQGSAPWQPTERAKWNAWNDCRDITKQEAEALYIDMVKTLKNSSHANTPSKKVSMGPKVSKMMMPVDIDEPPADDATLALYNDIKNDFTTLFEALERDPSIIHAKDEEGRSLLHWAVDANNLDATVILVERGADLNLKDSDGFSPLGYAASEDLIEIASYLFKSGASVELAGPTQSAIDLTADETLKALFSNQR